MKTRIPGRSATGNSASPQFPDRRHQRRDAVTTAVTAVDRRSGTRIDARTTDLSPGGCYVDAMNPFPAGTEVQVRLTKNGRSFDAEGRVAYSKAGVGMGLLFTAAPPQQVHILEEWLAEVNADAGSKAKKLDEFERVSAEATLKEEERLALQEVILLLIRKGVLTEDEGEPILRRLVG